MPHRVSITELLLQNPQTVSKVGTKNFETKKMLRKSTFFISLFGLERKQQFPLLTIHAWFHVNYITENILP
jgi:hypothetical protein